MNRWIPSVSMMLMSLISYVDRNTLALLAPTILKDTQLSPEQYGFIISAFSIAYMLANPVWGRVLDHWGVRLGMTAAVSLWTIASASHALAYGFLSFAVARIVLGFGEGATFPGGLRTVMQTLPSSLRSRGIAVAYSGGSLGAVVTPLIITPIAAAWGWHGAFLFTGLIGATWVAWWLMISRQPSLGRQAPEASIEAGRSHLSFKDPRVWGFMLAYAFGGLPIAFVLYFGSLYFGRVLHYDQSAIGRILWIPPLGWEIGFFFWGWVTDRFAEHGQSHRLVLRLLSIMLLLSLPPAFTHTFQSPWVVLALMSLAMFIAGGYVIAVVAYATQIFSSKNSGMIAGLGAGAWAALVALTMPIFGRLFSLQRYHEAFALLAAFSVVGFLSWLVTNRK